MAATNSPGNRPYKRRLTDSLMKLQRRIFKRRTVRMLIPLPARDALAAIQKCVLKSFHVSSVNLPPEAIRHEVPFSETSTIDASFLIATSSGLLHYDRGTLHKLLTGFFYGVTHYRHRWYAFRQSPTRLMNRRIGQVISFDLDDFRNNNIRIEANYLHWSIHQIDAWDSHLYVMESGNNRIIRFRINDHGLSNRRDFGLNTHLTPGAKTNHLIHANSIYNHRGNVYLVYHNQTTRTGFKSQIITLNNALDVDRVIDTDAGCVHNVVILTNGEMIYCDSQGGTVIWGDAILPCGYFTRGLAATDSFIIVGGSDFAKRDERGHATGYIFAFCSADRREFARLEMPGSGSIYEVRLIDPVDQAMSSSSRSETS